MNTDHKLKTDVLAELAWEPGVSADGGKIHLTGTVDSWSDRQTAASTAWAAAGTTSVENDICVC